jgi:hypothetical protein
LFILCVGNSNRVEVCDGYKEEGSNEEEGCNEEEGGTEEEGRSKEEGSTEEEGRNKEEGRSKKEDYRQTRIVSRLSRVLSGSPGN